MRTASNLLLFLFFVFSVHAYSAECQSWIHHLEQEHKVFVIPKTQINSSAYKYFEFPNSPYRIAVPKKYENEWKIETRSTDSGSSFAVYNTDFGYSGEFDKNGQCVNSTGFMYDNMDRLLPESLERIQLKFNYDWAACEKVEAIDKKHIKTLKKQTADDTVVLLQKHSPQDLSILDKESKSAGSNPIYKAQPSNASVLIETCRRQNEYLNLTVPKSQNIQVAPKAVK